MHKVLRPTRITTNTRGQ